MNNIFADIYTGVVNFILPPACICCDNLLNKDERFVCKSCLAKQDKLLDEQGERNEHL